MVTSYRDTTVQTLTLQPTVQDGVIIYEDSPLVSFCLILENILFSAFRMTRRNYNSVSESIHVNIFIPTSCSSSFLDQKP